MCGGVGHVLQVGLTGGIASGKSAVAAVWHDLGATVVDSDALAREVVAPGTPGLAEVVERFGPDVLAPDGSLDRPALGGVVFGDERARRDLEAIIHPRVRQRTAELVAAADDSAIVVHDIPLLVELQRAADYDLVVVVGAPVEVRVERMVRLRGMTAEEARRRIAAQADDEQRRAVADIWIDNDTTVDALEHTATRIWHDVLVPRQLASGDDRRPAR